MRSERVPLQLHLDDVSPRERAIWDRYLSVVESAGPSEMVVTKSRIAFRAAHRIFTGGFFKSGRFELFFDLPEPVWEEDRDERFRQVWQQGKRLWVHRLKIEDAAQLDRKLARWLSDSHAAYSKRPDER
jgi:hypothetical protein